MRSVARKLAWAALLNAYNRVLHGTNQLDDIANQLEAMTIELHSDTLQPDWSHPRLGSAVSLGSSEGPISCSSVVSFTEYVHFIQQPVLQYLGEEGYQQPVVQYLGEEGYEEELRVVAKKLVNKALHFACKTVESLYRRSSIEYLIASTKRMKISHSPPPLTAFDHFQTSGGRSLRSPSPEACISRLGSKRQRSGSHDIAMLPSEGETKKLIIAGKTSEPRQILRVRHVTPPHYVGSSVSHTSIAEESESESLVSVSDDEDSYTILDAVQQSGVPDETVPRIIISQAPTNAAIADMDMYVIIHSYPPSSPCQKFLCVNTNEVNVIYHCWLYRDSPYSPEHTLNCKLEMGVFCPLGVEAVHLDLQDAGIPFHFLDDR